VFVQLKFVLRNDAAVADDEAEARKRALSCFESMRFLSSAGGDCAVPAHVRPVLSFLLHELLLTFNSADELDARFEQLTLNESLKIVIKSLLSNDAICDTETM